MSRSIPTEDRISSLPDPIICHILSFLSTKLAATTSVLSKRWESIWLSLPTLHFDDETFKSFSSFRNSVSNVFLSRNIMLPLRSFHLISSEAYNLHHSHDVNRFVYAAVQRGIENLNLKICNRVSFGLKLPLSIFSCRTLVVLHLHGLTVNLSRVVVDFPLLKTLHLGNIHFARDQCLPKLLSGCPILEELQIKYLRRATLVLEENFQCLPNLIRANISEVNSSATSVLFSLLCGAKFLCVEPRFIGYINFPTFQNLIHLELTLKHKRSENWKWVIQVLKHCPKLQNLTIHEDSGNGNEVVGDWMDPTIVPECLSTHLRTCLLEGFKNMECEVQFAKYIMQNAKVLNTISIKTASSIDLNVKYQMISKLASSARASTTCELLFD